MPETSFFNRAAPANGRARTTPDRLDGTVALVTGASSGIGAATAIALASERAAVAVAARRKEHQLEEVAAGIRDQGGTVLVLESDITDEQQATHEVERTVAELGRLDTLVNNAGVMLLWPGGRCSTLSEWRAADGQPQRPGPALLRARSLAAPASRGRGGPAPGGRHRAHQLHGGPDRPQWQRRLHPDQARHRRAQRGAAPGSYQRHVRVSLVEPDATATDLAGHTARVLEAMRGQVTGMQPMGAEDIADMIAYIVTRPRHFAGIEVLIRPTEQA